MARGAVARGKKIAKCLPRRKRTTDKLKGKIKGQFIAPGGEAVRTTKCVPRRPTGEKQLKGVKKGEICTAYGFPHAKGRGKCAHPAPAGSGSCGGRSE